MRSKWLKLALAAGMALGSVMVYAEGGGPAGPAPRVLTFSPAGLHAERGASASTIEMDGCTSRVERVGAPDLPRQLYRLVVPRDLEVSEINLGDVSWEEIPGLFNVEAVAKPTPLNGLELPVPPVADPMIYESTNFYPVDPIELIADEFRFGYRVVTLAVYPLRYSPAAKRLELMTQVDFSLAGKSRPAGAFAPRRRSVQAQQMVQAALGHLVKNPEELAGFAPETATDGGEKDASAGGEGLASEWPSMDGLPVDYLIITSDELAPAFEPLAEWKRSRGWNTEIRTASEIAARYAGVDPQEKIRNFIIDAGELWGSSFVLLGGDVNQVPVRFALWDYYSGALTWRPTDLYYATAEGNWNANGNAQFGESDDESDLAADFFLGRAPVENLDECEIFVDKVLRYEKTPPSGFAESSLLMGAALSTGNPNWGQTIKQAIYENDLPAGYDTLRLYNPIYEGDALLTSSSAYDALEEGYHYVNHADHSNPLAMGTGAKFGGGFIYSNEVIGLGNGDRCGIVFSLGCSPNAFDSASISEAFLNAPDGGAVAFIGNISTGWSSQTIQDRAFFDEIFENHVTQLGEAFTLSRESMNGAYYRGVMNLLGDPAMVLWTAEPGKLSVNHRKSLTTGPEEVWVGVKDTATGQAVSGARVTLYKKDEVLVSGTTDAAGEVTLDVSCDSKGAIELVVTSQDYRPHVSSLPVYPDKNAQLFVAAQELDDDTKGASDGNTDGRADAGETIEDFLSITNGGDSSVYSVTAQVTSLTPGVTVVAKKVEVGTLKAGETALGKGLVLSCAESIGPETWVELKATFFGNTLTIGGLSKKTQWLGEDTFGFVVHRPEVFVNATRIVDDGSGQSQGNGNGIAEAGEIIELYPELANEGYGAARAVSTFAEGSAHLVVHKYKAYYGDLPTRKAISSKDPIVVELTADFGGRERLTFTISDRYRTLVSTELDFVVPNPPTNLRFESGADYILLKWDPAQWSGRPDRLGCHVYRRAAGTHAFERLSVLVQSGATIYRDEDVASAPSYEYYVTSVDTSGNESLASETLSAWTTWPQQPGWPKKLSAQPSTATAIDIDGDGEQEVFLAARDGMIYAFRYDGLELVDLDGNPTTTSGYVDLGGSADPWAAPSIADLDGDGTFEMVVTSRGGEDTLYAFSILREGEPVALAGWPVSFASGEGRSLTEPTLADVDGDGGAELCFVAERQGTVHLLDATGQDLPGWPKTAALGGWSYSSPVLVDLDGDGDLEIVAAGRNGKVFIWHHDGQAFAGWEQPFDSGRSDVGSPALGDLDGDGALEIVVNLGARVFALELDQSSVSGWEGGKSYPPQEYRLASPALGDVDGDGALEVFLTTMEGVSAWDSDGSVLAGSWPVDLGTEDETSSSPAIADIDGDGIPEIVVGYGDKHVHAFEADGSIAGRWPAPVDASVGASPTIADLDGDGDLEILVGAGESLYIWDSTGSWPETLIEWGTIHGNARHNGLYEAE